MTLNTLTPNLMVENVEATVEWYEQVLDAETVGTVPSEAEGQLWWAQVMIDEVPLMFQHRDSLEEEYPPLEGAALGGSLTFYIDVDDADGLHDRLETTDAERVQELRDTDYDRREFAIQDCNGYILWFGEKVDQ